MKRLIIALLLEPSLAPETVWGDSTISQTGTTDMEQTLATEPMIVRTGHMSLVVEDVAASMDLIADLADTFDGRVVSSGIFRNGDRLTGSISIRVAVDYFDEAILALRGIASEVNSETTSSKDVTEEYVDLEAKLRNLHVTEEQLLRIMEQAENVEDILKVQRELTRIRGEIEQTQGRMQYLERTTSSSLIEVGLSQSSLGIQFNANKNSVKPGEDIRFFVDIIGGFGPYSYAWDFGDGSISTSQMPIHDYNSKGSYTVTLKVTDDKGNSDEQIRQDYITVIPDWIPGNVVSGAWNALATFGRGLVNVLIVVGIFSPVWIVIGGITYWILRRRKKTAA